MTSPVNSSPIACKCKLKEVLFQVLEMHSDRAHHRQPVATSTDTRTAVPRPCVTLGVPPASYPVLLPNYPVWNIKLVHCLMTSKSRFSFWRIKQTSGGNPHCKVKCYTISDEGEINHTNQRQNYANGTRVMMLLFFLRPNVSSAGPLPGCLPRELLAITRLPWSLFNQ